MKIFNQIKTLNRYLPSIDSAAQRYNIDRDILLAIAILENFNRPYWLRFLEKNLSKYLNLRFKTLGLMQVKSEHYITDEESIYIAAKLISSFNYRNNLSILGELYNGSKEYGKCLNYVVSEIKNSLN